MFLLKVGSEDLAAGLEAEEEGSGVSMGVGVMARGCRGRGSTDEDRARLADSSPSSSTCLRLAVRESVSMWFDRVEDAGLRSTRRAFIGWSYLFVAAFLCTSKALSSVR
jgi:hypothetical protein